MISRLLFVVSAGLSLAFASAADLPQPAAPLCEHREQHDPDGTGLFYCGREIALVMGHQAANWLDRPTREEEEKTSRLIAALQFHAGETVADIGAGTGYISEKIARQVGTNGLVYATDIQPEMIAKLEAKMKALGLPQVRGLLGTITNACLPKAAVDTVILVDVYHEFDHPYEMARSMIDGLKPGGRLVFVEFRGEDPNVPIKTVHKMTEAQVKKEMSLHSELVSETNIAVLPWQHILVFRRK